MAHASDGRGLEFKLPDLGEGLTEAEIVRWMVEVGDVVAVDQPVVEVETAKAMVEVPCPYGGVVTARFGEEGTELPVGAPLLTVAVGESVGDRAAGGPGTGREAVGKPPGEDTGEPRTGEVRGEGPRGDQAPAEVAEESGVEESGAEESGARRAKSEGSGNVLVGYGTAEAPARRRRVRPVPSASTTSASTTSASTTSASAMSASGRANGQVVRAAGTVDGTVDGPVPVISPLVRRLARHNDLDLRELTGSGPEGLILRADVEYALRAAATQGGRTTAPEGGSHRAASGRASAPAVSATRPGGTRTPLKGVRGAVADKLSRSRHEIPDATCWVDADATELMRARTAMNAAGDPKISLVALLARICTAALARFPELNSTVDTEAREVVQLDRVHLGFAAQTDRGLVVPVVRDAHARDAEALTGEFARLTEAARAGRLTPGELTGGTFTLNNYGVFGVDGSTPIINHPEAAMLGVGRIVPKPWVHDGELAVRQVVQLSLTFDHRVCDGGTAGGFLRYVADCVEQPTVLLRTL
ncbi:2-oxo acid dehydrogenase subunit E2 [Streptomyces marokkonensis]|uniref:Dihydrolipoamide acetyltransferase component of pyruvate dehydrogenase complex n=1 Tax=Streptomyces marokkonensis TaxID=324855 RepID=A0ABP7Q3A8_9ACTN